MTLAEAPADLSSTVSARGARAVRRYVARSGKLIGRPSKLPADEETIRRVLAAGKIQCTVRETAAVMNVSLSVLQQFFDDCPEVKEMWDDARERGKRSLRRAQFKGAIEGNPQLLIWTGKQYLGQSDKSDVSVSLDLRALVLGAMADGPPALPGPETEP